MSSIVTQLWGHWWQEVIMSESMGVRILYDQK